MRWLRPGIKLPGESFQVMFLHDLFQYHAHFHYVPCSFLIFPDIPHSYFILPIFASSFLSSLFLANWTVFGYQSINYGSLKTKR